MRIRFALIGLAATGAAVLSACGSSNSSHPVSTAPNGAVASSSMPVMDMSSGASSPNPGGMGTMPMASGTGLDATMNGYTLTSAHVTPMSGMDMPVTFTITKGGKPVTQFDAEQTKLMHFYLIRSDLSGFQHLHPTMASDGTWTVTPMAIGAGTYRFYVQFLPHADASAGALVLSRPFDVAGADATKSAAVPTPSSVTTVDGYNLTVGGSPVAGSEVPLTITVTRDAKPVTTLQPYLDTYAHVTAIHAGDLAFAHLHPSGVANGDHGGPLLTVNADLPEKGSYRVFIQFQTNGALHTAALTLTVS